MTGEPSRLPRQSLRPSLDCVDLQACATLGGFDLAALPRPHRIMLENIVAHEGALAQHLAAFARWLAGSPEIVELPFWPGRILSHDTAGIAVLVDLAALREKVAQDGGDPRNVTSAVPIDLVVDHSVAADMVGSAAAMAENVRREMARNGERYRFLRWAEKAFGNLRIIPPGNGICHQVNMEYLASGILPNPVRPALIQADTVIGTDSHTTMINALGILGWGVGGIEAEAVAVGQPLIMALPAVTGCRLVGQRRPMVTAADIALAVARQLRDHGVVGKFVEFSGPGLDHLTLADRAAIANMAPEYGATCGWFPIDAETIRYLRETNRPATRISDIVAHAHATGLWRDDSQQPVFSDTLTIDLGEIAPLVAGPRRPQERVPLAAAPTSFRQAFPDKVVAPDEGLRNGDVVIASITSCTHTSNPHQLIAAGLLACNARKAGLAKKPWVKTSLSPGSRVVEDYLRAAGLQPALDELGFHIIGFGCMTCAGDSGGLDAGIVRQIRERDLTVCAALSANRNFEGRTHPDVRACYLASPPLIVAYALAGSILTDLSGDVLGEDADGRPMRLADIWPSDAEVDAVVRAHINPDSYQRAYSPEGLKHGAWDAIEAPAGDLFPWDKTSTHVRLPPFFERSPGETLADFAGARPLAVLGDNITTDHISPFGRILPDSAAAEHLLAQGVPEEHWSSYAERRGNHEVLWRGTFSNPRIRNAIAGGRSGGVTIGPGGDTMKIVDAADAFRAAGIPTVVFAGKEYGTGSARDWAAKGTRLLGVRAVIAESFERIHRGNLVGMGVVPCQLPGGTTVGSLGIGADTSVAIEGLAGLNGPLGTVRLVLTQPDGATRIVPLTCRIDTEAELAQIRQGGLFATAEASVRQASR
jgi:aconitate hydratase A / 2-methylisocitrate dehydratase